MFASCTSLYDRMIDLLSCQYWFSPANQNDLDQPMLQPPAPHHADCFAAPELLHNTLGSLKQHSRCRDADGVAGSTDGSWDIDALHASRPLSPLTDSAHHSCTSASSNNIPCASEGIELHDTAVNVLLGQYHMQTSGQFVPARPGKVKPVALLQQHKQYSL